MDKHEIFRIYVLPHLLEKANKAGATDEIVSISLFGSANYRPDAVRPEQLPEKDFDIWIVMKEGSLQSAQRFASELFGANFIFETSEIKACILYDKFHRKFPIGQLLISPMIVMEESYSLANENYSQEERNDILVPWFRPRSRERVPESIVCSPLLQWMCFDMQQLYVEAMNLWQLMMPIIVTAEGSKFLGTFVECAVTGRFFYGDAERYAALNKKLLESVINHLFLNEKNIPLAEFYKMLTTSQKAGTEFGENLTKQFASWLNNAA
ncbi:MAG: hypothetical protein UR60_C0004G0004 [Candidatus Moranbacteria bacterium GW2011_GWF2_34_56]|nr:MAG: hypothetical protein UR51_C0010G0069 [Candidatus Moranbacteria bacterium GW2011_GWF1_34_10]KKP65275.1 MAG: hypothetical protein UR60_C0004G0004 [Candidatus Moranbacteria bacterium GW2011_GWF2_34_56]HBI16880.1 hypothetical protein [Candidatus Moranbacteria bacterium]